MKQIARAISESSFILDMKAMSFATIFDQVLNLAVSHGRLASDNREQVAAALLKREREAPTALGHSVAVPHAYLDVVTEPTIVFVRLARPLNLHAPDGVPVRFVIVLIGPPNSAETHLDTLAAIARLMSDVQFRYDAGEATSRDELLAALRWFQQRTNRKIREPAPTVSDGLQFTGRLFGGIRRDIARRLPYYVADFRDGLHSKTVSSTLFLFFACLAPAVTFGGLMAVETDGHIGAVEMLVATAVCGVFYSLFSGTPLIILGGTGPLLVLTSILFGICRHFDIPFLWAYAWIGMWSGLFIFILAATDASSLMRFFTRFTDEIFAALISIIFIAKSIESLAAMFHDGETPRATALFSLLLALGTFYIAMSLSKFRNSRYLLRPVREFLADFGPAISLSLMALIAFWDREVHLTPLPTPAHFEPTLESRAWFVNPLAAPMWLWFASIGPALMVAVLVYLDQNITARLVNNPDHKLVKGEAYHLDLALIGLQVMGCSLFGLPWLVAATVRSLNHVRSLATTEDVDTRGGETRARIIHVRETRLSGFAIHLLIGCSLLLLPLLKNIPMAVLYGLFLYMGVVSIAGNQFFGRLNLWLMDRTLYPVTHYTRRVPEWTIHKFTLIQLLGLALLLIIERSPLAITFPICIALLVPFRVWIGRWFKPEHLAALDADEIPEEEERGWL